MRRRILAGMLLGVLLGAFASPGATAVSPSANGAVVEGMSFDEGGERVLVYIKTSDPVPPFVCEMQPDPSAPYEVLFELPHATSLLESAYRLDSPLVTAARVESGYADGVGVRVRFSLGSAVLTKIEQLSSGILLRFERAPWREEMAFPAGLMEYRVGTGDKLEIAVFGHDDLNKIVQVRSDGTINLPLIGDVEVAHKSVAEVDELITSILGQDYLVNPQVSVDVREYQSRWITIIGAIRNPSRYILTAGMRLIDLLAGAGGLTSEAGPEILISRRVGDGGGRVQLDIRVDRLYSRDNVEANIPLQPGDIITIGQREIFYIRGEVNRPGPYIVTAEMTLLRAIGVAGGLSQFANRKSIELLRAGEDATHERVIVNLKAIESGKGQDIPLRANDIIIVPRRIF